MSDQKFVMGIDISMDDFHVCAKVKKSTGEVKIKGTRSFANTEKGFRAFYTWSKKRVGVEDELYFVMEATGVYYENLAYFLYAQGEYTAVVLANKAKNFAKSLNIKTKTDKVDSKIIAELGLERKLERWEPMSSHYKEVRDLCRELLSLKKEMTRAKSQLHAMEHSYRKSSRVIKLKNEQIDFYENAIDEIHEELKRLVADDLELKEKLEKVQTIPGIGFETSIILASETNGFRLFKNIRQVVSYAGLDVAFNESGIFKGKTRITKKGNSRIRQALYMPSLSALRDNEPIKMLYERVCERNPEVKKKGVVAAMRKLLILTFVLWKKNEAYDKNYVWG
ncbi:MAG TPA: IS110 family transposase [Gracilimonas sp.]|nr:IS110 family transposase [Gracilimonas sp.]